MPATEAARWMLGKKAPGQEQVNHGSQNAESSQQKLHGLDAFIRLQHQECDQEQNRAAGCSRKGGRAANPSATAKSKTSAVPVDPHYTPQGQMLLSPTLQRGRRTSGWAQKHTATTTHATSAFSAVKKDAGHGSRTCKDT